MTDTTTTTTTSMNSPTNEVGQTKITPIIGNDDLQNEDIGVTEGDTSQVHSVLDKAIEGVMAEKQQHEKRMELEEAQQKWVTDMTIAEAKLAAADDDTYRKVMRISSDIRLERTPSPLNEIKNPQNDVNSFGKDVYIIVIAADSMHLPKSEYTTALDVEKRIKEAFQKEFGHKQGWRMSLLSFQNSTEDAIKSLTFKNGVLDSLFKRIQSIRDRRRAMFEILFRTPERPNKVVKPSYPYKPLLYTDNEVY
jgi:hypothetical protein